MEGGGTSADAAGVVGAPGSELGPGQLAVVAAYLSDLFFVALDAPMGADVVSVDEALFLLFSGRVSHGGGEGADDDFPGDIHVGTDYLIQK